MWDETRFKSYICQFNFYFGGLKVRKRSSDSQIINTFNLELVFLKWMSTTQAILNSVDNFQKYSRQLHAHHLVWQKKSFWIQEVRPLTNLSKEVTAFLMQFHWSTRYIVHINPLNTAFKEDIEETQRL